jgi:dTDP-4-dehydrorhamnose reductase
VDPLKILVLGATGMLGHKLIQVLSLEHTVTGTVRRDAAGFVNHPLFSSAHIIGNISAGNPQTIRSALEIVQPDVLINCIGIVKQLPEASDPLLSITVNSLFPHQLAALCRKNGIRMIHMSTDCVFSGKTGGYTEDDVSDADDLYGRTKFLGEVSYPGCLTLRTSIIGREMESSHGLIEWFLGNEGKTVHGFKRAVFSGLTTLALSEIICRIVVDYPDLHGVLQVAGSPISKYDLLATVKKVYGLHIALEPDETVVNNRTLSAAKFKSETNIKIPSWEYMIDQMHRDPTPYATLRRDHA